MAEAVDVGGDGPFTTTGGLTGSVKGDDDAFHGNLRVEHEKEPTKEGFWWSWDVGMFNSAGI